MGNSDDASLVIELVEERRDLPPAEGTGEDSGASPCKSTDWNSLLFEGEFWGVSGKLEETFKLLTVSDMT